MPTFVFEAPDARFEVADEHAVAGDRRVIFDDRPAQPGDLLAGRLARQLDLRLELCLHYYEVGRDIGAQRSMSPFNSSRSNDISLRNCACDSATRRA